MQIVNWDDHTLAHYINTRNMELINKNKQGNNTNYYANENYQDEILVIFDNENNTRTIILQN